MTEQLVSSEKQQANNGILDALSHGVSVSYTPYTPEQRNKRLEGTTHCVATTNYLALFTARHSLILKTHILKSSGSWVNNIIVIGSRNFGGRESKKGTTDPTIHSSLRASRLTSSSPLAVYSMDLWLRLRFTFAHASLLRFAYLFLPDRILFTELLNDATRDGFLASASFASSFGVSFSGAGARFRNPVDFLPNSPGYFFTAFDRFRVDFTSADSSGSGTSGEDSSGAGSLDMYWAYKPSSHHLSTAPGLLRSFVARA